MKVYEIIEARQLTNLDQETIQAMSARIPQLQARANAMLARLIKASTVAEELANVRVYVGIYDGFADADPTQRLINIDITGFYDAPDDVLAFVIGHELGHIALHHPSELHKQAELNRQEELDADDYGIELAQKLGYSRTNALTFTNTKDTSPADTFTHPSYDRRIQHSQEKFPQFQLSKGALDQLADLKAALA